MPLLQVANLCESAGKMEQWPDDKVKAHLDSLQPGEWVKWIVMDEDGLYGYVDSNGMQYAYADDDESRVEAIMKFLLRHGGYYECGP